MQRYGYNQNHKTGESVNPNTNLINTLPLTQTITPKQCYEVGWKDILYFHVL